MPLYPSLAAPGSPVRLVCCVLNWPASVAVHHPPSWPGRPQSRLASLSLYHRAYSSTATSRHGQQRYSSSNSPQMYWHEYTEDSSVSTDLSQLPASGTFDLWRPLSEGEESTNTRFLPEKSRMKRKRQRMSLPTAVLNSIHTTERELYLNPAAGKNRVSAGATCNVPPRNSLYAILSRYLDHYTRPDGVVSHYVFTAPEEDLLSKHRYRKANVINWATCLLERRSRTAVALFRDTEGVPAFVLLLFLRRQHIGASALNVILRHIAERYKADPPPWSTLQLLCVRSLRHARQHKPESIPWIASFFAAQANALFGEMDISQTSLRLVSDLTRFCNTLLLLISLPASHNPIMTALSQEKAQFHILQFMAGLTTPITVTGLGFRSVARNQLAHPKTNEEKDWAELKGASWPPWKENRTAMDEDKGYEYGASRASEILHRMYEAGYRGHLMEEIVEVYAGWDTDLSPTIQTRTSLPQYSTRPQAVEYYTSLLWASRVRTTRTRREAWACFLAYEMSGTPVSQHVYLAMFEKLYYSAMRRSSSRESKVGLTDDPNGDGATDDTETGILPGEMKEVLPDPTSPLHYVYLSEPIPTIKELYHRLTSKDVRPSGRLFAFLLTGAPSFDTCLKLLKDAEHDFNGGIGHLLSGQLDDQSRIRAVPSYLLAAFIQCLCRFGQFARPPLEETLPSPKEHAHALKHNSHYLLEYAYTLLCRYKPTYRPAWTAYIHKVAHSTLESTIDTLGHDTPHHRGMIRYKTLWMLVQKMEENDIEVDDRIFLMLCNITTHAAQATQTDAATSEQARDLFTFGSARLRRVFAGLVGATATNPSNTASTDDDDASLNIIPPHIPGPADLHAYVRALGTLHDYEGLYSFSTWLTAHSEEVTARSEAQHSGNKALFRTLVALRAAVTGYLGEGSEPRQQAPDEIVQLIEGQIESVEEWGGWPTQEHVDQYAKGLLKSGLPSVKGR